MPGDTTRQPESDAVETRSSVSTGLFRSGFAAFSYRNYRLFWFGQLVSVTGTWMQNLAQAWLVYETLGASPFQLGLANVLQFLPVLLFGIPSGVIADRFPKRNILMFTQTAMMLLATTMAVIVLTDIVQLWHVYVIAGSFGVANAVDMPTRQALVSEVVNKDALMNAIALNSALFNTGRIIGPAIAGIFLAIVGPGFLFALNAASFLAVLAALSMMNVTSGNRPSPEPPFQRLRDGLSYVRGDPIISRTILMVGMIGIFGMNFNVWVPVLASDYFNAGSSAYGSLFSAMGAGSLLGALSLAFFGRGPSRKRMLIAASVMGLAEITLAFIGGSGMELMLGALTLALIGFSTTNTMSTANTTVQQNAEDHLRGRVMAVYMTVFAGSIPVGALFAGWVTGQFGAPVSIATGGTMVLVAVAVQLWTTPRQRIAERSPSTKTVSAIT